MSVNFPIVKVEDVEGTELLRLMKANFDPVFDACYCIDNGVTWSAFMHQISTFFEVELLSELEQALTAAASFWHNL